MLHIILDDVMKKNGYSSRQVAKQTDVSHTTIVRVLRGETVDLGTIIKLSEWLNVKPSTMINSMSTTDDSLADKISVILERSPKLEAAFSQALNGLIGKEIPPSVLEDIAAYASYRLQLI